jgi:3-oxoacyl-[acyl-carrier protein] reductase
MSSSPHAAARHVLISGGSRGLGECLVGGLLNAGYRVSSFSRRSTEFTDRQAANSSFLFQTVDISDAKSLDAFLRSAESKLGKFYGLINCAGIAADGVLATMPEDKLESVISVNLTGALRLTRRVLRRMLLGPGGGTIINVSSIIGLRGYSGLAAYAATKAGMDAMTRALARELGHREIRVNSVAPGYLETEMTHGLSPEQKDQIVRRTPLGRLGRPADVVGPVLFLLSDAAAFITGQVLVIDGGITA